MKTETLLILLTIGVIAYTAGKKTTGGVLPPGPVKDPDMGNEAIQGGCLYRNPGWMHNSNYNPVL